MNLIIDVVMKADLFELVNINVTNSKIVPYCPRGVKDMVDQIIATVGNNKMKALRIWSHGITHYRGGEDYEKGNLNLGIDNIDADNIHQYESEFRRLAGYFAKPARVELRGCSPAKGTGKEMMAKMFRLWGV